MRQYNIAIKTAEGVERIRMIQSSPRRVLESLSVLMGPEFEKVTIVSLPMPDGPNAPDIVEVEK